MKSPKKKCITCYGYGLWAMGDASPMGPIDASDGLPTIACPNCGANANPSKTRHELDVEALYPTNPATDAHNDKIATMLELLQVNQELKERVRELEAETKQLRIFLYTACTTIEPGDSPNIKLDHEYGLAYLTHSPHCNEITIAGACNCALKGE